MNDQQIHGFLVMPAYNEAGGIIDYLARVQRYLQDLSDSKFKNFRWTVLVVNDGSADATEERLQEAAHTLSQGAVTIAYASLLRNFGHQAALLAGLRIATSKGASFVVTLDADGEHPVELIEELIPHWLAGAQVVHTSRLADERLSRFKGLSSRMYYKLLRYFGHLQILDGMADYKLWDGALLRQVRPYLNTCGSTRAFASWLSPHAPVVPYRQDVIEGRVSRFTFPKMASLAVNGLIRYSEFPIRLAFYVGLCALGLGSILFLFAVSSYFLGKTIPGWTSITALVVFFGGVQCFLLGIYGEYFLRNLFRANLPTFVIKQEQDDISPIPMRTRPAASSRSATIDEPLEVS
jgi:glycosyltransferase involved in cell wall biosynthesis